jgi:hypothetical protein
MNNSLLTSGQKAAATRKANEKTRKQVQAKKDAWVTRRERYGATGTSSKKEKSVLPTETKFVTIEDKKSGFKVMFEEGKVNTVMVWGKTIQLL